MIRGGDVLVVLAFVLTVGGVFTLAWCAWELTKEAPHGDQ